MFSPTTTLEQARPESQERLGKISILGVRVAVHSIVSVPEYQSSYQELNEDARHLPNGREFDLFKDHDDLADCEQWNSAYRYVLYDLARRIINPESSPTVRHRYENYRQTMQEIHKMNLRHQGRKVRAQFKRGTPLDIKEWVGQDIDRALAELTQDLADLCGSVGSSALVASEMYAPIVETDNARRQCRTKAFPIRKTDTYIRSDQRTNNQTQEPRTAINYQPTRRGA